MDAYNGIKICDFGVSKIINNQTVIKEQCGTPAYIAPEIISDEGYHGYFVDLWSLGVLLYAMLCATVPFRASNMKDLHTVIMKGGFGFPCDLTPEAINLVKSLLAIEPINRLSLPEVLRHPWLKEEESEFDDLNVYVGPSDFATDDDGDMGLGGGLGGMSTGPSQQPNINIVNISNLYWDRTMNVKLAYNDYCSISNDFYTQHIGRYIYIYSVDEDAVRVIESFGYPRSMLLKSLHSGELNHATASYTLLLLP